MLKKLLLFLIPLCLLCCQNETFDELPDDGSENPNEFGEFSENFGNEMTADFYGVINDINNSPLSDVMITIGNQTVLTDTNGIFFITNAQVFENFAYIRANKPGYLSGSRTIVPTNGLNKVQIILLEEIITETISSDEPSIVSSPDGASISFDGNFVNTDNTAYQGNVNVIMHFLDPTSTTISQQMPGMLYGQNILGEESILRTFGMLAVELQSESGETLNLAEGSSAEISVPLDVSLSAVAPSTIPLWYFDETNGYWIEEGVATLQGNRYVGSVSHFSFWNCDIYEQVVKICINVNDNTGEPLENLYISLISDILGEAGQFTNESGSVCGIIPANQVLTLEASANANCQTVYSQTIGPLNTDANINITIPSLETILVNETVTGSVYSCNNELIQNGYTVLNYNGINYLEILNDGTFEIDLNRCLQSDAEFSFVAYDSDNLMQTQELINQSFNTPITDLGSLTTCDEAEFFITFQIDDDDPITIFEDNLVGEAQPNTVYISQFNQQPYAFQAFVDEDGTVDLLDIRVNGEVIYDDCLDFDNDGICDNLDNMNYDLTEWGSNIGDVVSMSFNGTIVDPNGNTRTLSGSLNVEVIF